MQRQPIEVLAFIIDEVDCREDLLSLALTCVRLLGIVIPSHLVYRRVVISLHFQPFYDLIRTRPELAKRVRELTLVHTSPSAVIPRAHAFRREFPESRLLFASGYDDEFLYPELRNDVSQRRPIDIRASLAEALYHLPRLRRLHFCGHSIAWSSLERVLEHFQGQLDGLSFDEIVSDAPVPFLHARVSRRVYLQQHFLSSEK